MKTLIILILTLALLAAAFFTRPSEADFRLYVRQTAGKDDRNLAEKIFRPSPTDALLHDTEFKDRYLWVEVRKDGKTLYAGAFDHWFDRGGRANRQ